MRIETKITRIIFGVVLGMCVIGMILSRPVDWVVVGHALLGTALALLISLMLAIMAWSLFPPKE